jgi:hypothetical protein
LGFADLATINPIPRQIIEWELTGEREGDLEEIGGKLNRKGDLI